ncbi:thioredoxin O1, mitochondrial-like [Andrographis paniculata]|uniref:thioredoxin O1, mitochondrial-like n=1 Tax=Andrographis paniculata TaxID=175694 RepID=UPI0021E7C6FF|nr:thioredoxin O1, mitochondrial-like [Andrographis paniculata]
MLPLRRLLRPRAIFGIGGRSRCTGSSPSSIIHIHTLSSTATTLLFEDAPSPLLFSQVASAGPSLHPPLFFLNHYRTFSTFSAPDPPRVVSIESEEQYNDSLRKVQDESLSAVFYFAAVWCGPCRLLSPIIGQLSDEYPHVTIYKIDIEKEGVENVRRMVNLTAVPTLYFFQNGKNTDVMLGTDAKRLKNKMEELYK